MFTKKSKTNLGETSLPLEEKDIKKSEEINDPSLKEDYVELKHVNKVYNKKVHAVIDFNLKIRKKEFIVFVGPSGCGKSTTLRMIAGLEDISSGELYINDEYCNDLSPKDRDIAMVFQSYSLYPNMTVYDNLAFSLKVRHLPKEEIDQRVKSAAEILEIKDYLERKPKELSGGQRQRVALGRAIVRNARLFLMDEPLSNLDAKLRVTMRSEIIRLHKAIGSTTIYVTHDQTEAMTMADRIVVMKKGYIQQVGSPVEIYRYPANLFVASFIGSPAMNVLEGTYDKGTITFKDGNKVQLSKEEIAIHDEFFKQELVRQEKSLPLAKELLKKQIELKSKKKRLFKKAEPIIDIEEHEYIKTLKEHIQNLHKVLENEAHPILFGIRPEDIIPSNEENSFTSKVCFIELLGDQYYVHFHYGEKEILSKVSSELDIKEDEDIRFSFRKNKFHLFDIWTEKSIL